MITTIIVAENSNLSSHLTERLDNNFVVASRKISNNVNILSVFKNEKVNIIFNNFHPAVSLSDLTSAENYITNSIGNTAKILDYCKKHSIQINKIIYTSSSSVYGNNILCNENDELKPLNLHAALKVANEKLIEKFCLENNIDYTIARIFNMYGGNDKFSVIGKIINAYTNQEELTIVNKGNAIRDFIHIDDVVEIYIKLLKIENVKIINIGTGNGSSIKNILDFLFNHNIKIQTKNIQREELKISTADTKKLQQLLNKEKFLEVEEYLKKELNI